MLELSSSLRNQINTIALQETEPFYIYESEKIRQKCNMFIKIPYSNKAIYFASMANASPKLLRIVKDAGLNIFVNSVGHMELVQSIGWQGREIIFTASAMDEQSMHKVHEAGAIVNLDSISQFATWNRLFPNTPAGLRCNIGDQIVPRETRGGYFLGPESRLGLTMDEIKTLAGSKSVAGLHLYLGTDITDNEYFVECYRHIVNLARLFPEIQYLDFGGGFGISMDNQNSFDFKRYGDFVKQVMEKVSEEAGHSVQFILEPGRIISAEAGYFVCRVTDVKDRQPCRLVGVNGSTAQFTRPLFYPNDSFHPISVISKKDQNGKRFQTSVYGCSTYSRDFFARDIELPDVQIGDMVVFSYAGSYCGSSHTQFLGFKPAKEYFV